MPALGRLPVAIVVVIIMSAKVSRVVDAGWISRSTCLSRILKPALPPLIADDGVVAVEFLACLGIDDGLVGYCLAGIWWTDEL